MQKSLLLLVFSSVLAWSSVFGGTKEEIIRLQSDVLQLQDLIRTLQKGVDEKNGMMVSLLEQLNDQVAESNVGFKELATATGASRAQVGSLEEVISLMREELQVLSTKLDETNNRVANLSRRMEENQVQIQTLRTVQSTDLGEVEPDRVYSASYNDYLMGNYALSVNGFQDFLASFPDSEYADNAAYYLGDSYLKQGNMELAIQAFEQVINLYPKGDKTAVAYYKKASALQQMQRIEQAIDSLKKLVTLFPESPEARLAQEELTRLGVS